RLQPRPRYIEVPDQGWDAAQMKPTNPRLIGRPRRINPQDFMRPFAAPPSDSSSSTMELLHEFETSGAQGPEAIGRWEGPAVPREGWDIEKGNDDYTLE